MASFSTDKKRNVVPNWREYNKTAKLGEFGDSGHPLTAVTTFFPIDEYVLDWQSNKTIPFAGDLISAAILNGQMTNKDAVEAAQFILAMYSGGYPFSVPVIPVHFLGVKTDYLLRS